MNCESLIISIFISHVVFGSPFGIRIGEIFKIYLLNCLVGRENKGEENIKETLKRKKENLKRK